MAAEREDFRARVDAPEGSAVFSKSRLRWYSANCSAALGAFFAAVLLADLRAVLLAVLLEVLRVVFAAVFLAAVVVRVTDFLAGLDAVFFPGFLRTAMISRGGVA